MTEPPAPSFGSRRRANLPCCAASATTNGQGGIYLYDFDSGGFFYTSLTFPFPFLYDFSLQPVVYYFVSSFPPGGPADAIDTRYFYVFSLGQIITK